MTYDFQKDPRFEGLSPFKERVALSTPTTHDGAEMNYIREAYDSGWVTTVGENINEIERLVREHIGVSYAVALNSGTSAIHLAIKLAAERLYQSSTGVTTPEGKGAGGALAGKRVFVSDLTFDATVNPIVYEGGEPVLIDSEYDTWNMDPDALEKAFAFYPDVRLVILVHLYGVPAKIREIREICERRGALLIEDAAESLGAEYDGKQTGSFGDYGILSFNGNKIITGSTGGMLLCHDSYSADKARKWSTQAREAAPWYEHEELGYNYRISNLVAGMVRGQWPFLEEHIHAKKQIYERYRENLKGLPVKMNADSCEGSPNYWLSCMTIDDAAMADMVRSGRASLYRTKPGKSCPDEILDVLNAFHAEGRPVWKPMHMQPVYAANAFVTKDGNGRASSNAYIKNEETVAVSADLFHRGLCLPSDIKMTPEQADAVSELVRRCFGRVV